MSGSHVHSAKRWPGSPPTTKAATLVADLCPVGAVDAHVAARIPGGTVKHTDRSHGSREGSEKEKMEIWKGAPERKKIGVL